MLGRPGDHAQAHHLGVREEAVEVRGALGIGGREGGAIEGSRGRVEQGQLAARVEVREVDDQVGALRRSEHEPVRRHRDGAA